MKNQLKLFGINAIYCYLFISIAQGFLSFAHFAVATPPLGSYPPLYPAANLPRGVWQRKALRW